MSDSNNELLGIGMGVAGNLAGGLFQRNSNKKNMKRQFEYQQKLNRQGHDLQFDMWNKTNYPAQLEMMKKAGLNPGLMYGLGGGGGTTTGSQGGGSAAGGQAPMMDMGIDPTTAAQIRNIEANTSFVKAQEDNLRGEEGTKGAQEIAESIARSSNLDADTAKKLQEATNLKTLDQWNVVKKDLDLIKRTKQVTGSTVTDMLTNLGLDPVNNEEDRTTFRALVGAYLGANMLEKVMGSISKIGVGKKKPGGITINNKVK